MSQRPAKVPGRGPPRRHLRQEDAGRGEQRGGYAMTAPSNHPAEIERAREARETLVELRDWIPDDDGSQSSFALAEVVRTWNASEADPIWVALIELIPPRTDEPVDEACETIRRHAVKLLEALWDSEHQ